MLVELKTLIKAALDEDLGNKGDITSQATISSDQKITATIHAREDGVLSGIEIAIATFLEIDSDLKIETFKKDSDFFKKSDKILTVSGNAINILKAERVALNFLSHLSGIATQTSKYVEAVKGTNAKIYDTRKTLPAYRTLHKKAVKDGGGQNHRFGLYDAILIKDNHIAAAGSVGNALNAVKNISPLPGERDRVRGIFIQIEVDSLQQLEEVLKNGTAHSVLLDNMPPDILKESIQIINGQLISEASGGITLKNVKEIAQTGVDRISIGALTHTITPIDFGLDIS